MADKCTVCGDPIEGVAVNGMHAKCSERKSHTCKHEELCDQCHGYLGTKHYSDVPEMGNLCLTCHQDWHRAKMAIGDYDAINAPVYHAEETRTALEIAKQANIPVGSMDVNSIGMCKLCGYKGPGPKHDCSAEGKRIHGVPGPLPKDEDQVTKSQVEAMIAEEAAPPSRPGTIDEWMDSTNLSDIHRDIATAIADRLERCEKALNHILEDIDRLDCTGRIDRDRPLQCITYDRSPLEHYCARCMILYWTKKGLGHGS